MSETIINVNNNEKSTYSPKLPLKLVKGTPWNLLNNNLIPQVQKNNKNKNEKESMTCETESQPSTNCGFRNQECVTFPVKRILSKITDTTLNVQSNGIMETVIIRNIN